MNSSSPPIVKRLSSIDGLRGAIMIVMALDHVRDFLHADAMFSSPTDLTRTTPALFFTRWITHFCLPVFMFTAGVGTFLWWTRGRHTKRQLSRFLGTRGLWFIALELTVMQLAYNFNLSPRFPILLLILWIFGICMILLAPLIWFSRSWLLAFSLFAIAFHNTLDGLNASSFGSVAWLWNIIHQPGMLAIGGKAVLVTYTILPWLAVLTLGFCFGEAFTWSPPRRQRLMIRSGFLLIFLFVLLRAVNRYGDPVSWSALPVPFFTLLSFLNCTKYPASLDFLLMTLGPALLLLAYLDKKQLSSENPLVIFGRVPLFYFVLHFYLIHSVAVLLAWLRYGTPALSFVFGPLPSMGGSSQIFPPHFGYSLGVVYAVWIVIVLCLYPLCKWFARVKATNHQWWLSYL